ncbi:hypothetical protein FACS1894109_18830 [Spirochaetia bacterium]|nr:hypothetical protein FACS1894109_18830 [Spirochaetia bacterium]
MAYSYRMSNTELLIKEIQTLTDDCAGEVLDFVGYLKQKYPESASEKPYVCPVCGKMEHVPNAEAIAAMQEVNDMIDGKISAQSFHSLDELLEDMES